MVLNWRTVSIGGVQTSYVDEGRGHTIVLVHGCDIGWGSTGMLVWERNIQSLARSHQVIAFDRLGSGYTGNPPTVADYRVSTSVEHAIHLLDWLDVTTATLVGQSRGAFIAAYIALTRPDLVSRLVLTNSASFDRDAANPGGRISGPGYQGLPETVESDLRWLSVGREHITEQLLIDSATILERPESRLARRQFELAKWEYFVEIDAMRADLHRWFETNTDELPVLFALGSGSVGAARKVSSWFLVSSVPCFRLWLMAGCRFRCS